MSEPLVDVGSVRYRTIVADPPWAYPDGFGGFDAAGKGKFVRRELPYAAMSVGEVSALPVGDLADSVGANLFLWTTNRYLPDAFDVLAAWGAKYRQAAVWHKTGAPPLSGSIAPTACEFLLFARIGRGAPIGQHWDSPVVTTKRLANSHSRKPDCFLDLIEQVSPGPYLEMFARRARFGWDYWGNESLNTAEVAA